MFWGSHHPILMATFWRRKLELTLKLTVDEANFVLQVLGELPTKSGAFPLVMKIKQQADAQVEQKPETPPAE
jgi:hypothetical protein